MNWLLPTCLAPLQQAGDLQGDLQWLLVSQPGYKGYHALQPLSCFVLACAITTAYCTGTRPPIHRLAALLIFIVMHRPQCKIMERIIGKNRLEL